MIFLISSCAGGVNQELPTSGDPEEIPTPIVVRILNLDAAIELSQSTEVSASISPPTGTQVIISTSTPIPNSVTDTELRTSTSTPSCLNRAEFMRHLSISDNTALEAGQMFAKIWQIKNVGSCNWTSQYTLRFFSGELMSGPAVVEIPQEVKPGEIVELRVNLVAPMQTSFFTGNWVLSDPEGNLFGIGENGDQPITVIIQVKPTPLPSPG
jgi:hypothetical protein